MAPDGGTKVLTREVHKMLSDENLAVPIRVETVKYGCTYFAALHYVNHWQKLIKSGY